MSEHKLVEMIRLLAAREAGTAEYVGAARYAVYLKFDVVIEGVSFEVGEEFTVDVIDEDPLKIVVEGGTEEADIQYELQSTVDQMFANSVIDAGHVMELFDEVEIMESEFIEVERMERV